MSFAVIVKLSPWVTVTSLSLATSLISNSNVPEAEGINSHLNSLVSTSYSNSYSLSPTLIWSKTFPSAIIPVILILSKQYSSSKLPVEDTTWAVPNEGSNSLTVIL